MILLEKKNQYPNFPSAMKPFPHPAALHLPISLTSKSLLPSSDEEMPSGKDSVKSISSEDNVSVY